MIHCGLETTSLDIFLHSDCILTLLVKIVLLKLDQLHRKNQYIYVIRLYRQNYPMSKYESYQITTGFALQGGHFHVPGIQVFFI